MFKVGDIVKVVKLLKSYRILIIIKHEKPLPQYMLGQIGLIKRVYRPSKHNTIDRTVYQVYFLMDLSVENGYIADATLFLYEEEMVMADENEKMKFLDLLQTLKAKNLADKI